MNEQNHVIHKNGQVSTDQVDSAIEKIAPEERDQILQNFDAFKEYLGKRIAMGESIGLSEEQMAKIAQKVADHLAANEEPRNREEKSAAGTVECRERTGAPYAGSYAGSFGPRYQNKSLEIFRHKLTGQAYIKIDEAETPNASHLGFL